MKFLSDFLFNIGLLILGGIILLVLFPKEMGDVYQVAWTLFGPIILVVLLINALPGRRRRG